MFNVWGLKLPRNIFALLGFEVILLMACVYLSKGVNNDLSPLGTAGLEQGLAGNMPILTLMLILLFSSRFKR